MQKIRVLVVFGTRPEAIKMAPILWELHRQNDRFIPITVVTGQHKEMLTQCLTLFKIKPDYDLQIMTERQTLEDITCAILKDLPKVFDTFRPDVVLVQGDTTTSFATALSAYYHSIPVGHVEAGLRTHEKFDPYPEEINRHLTGVLADLHFAPTRLAQENLMAEGISANRIHLTGNTIVDALQEIVRHACGTEDPLITSIRSAKRKIWLLTLHRRESFGKRMEGIFRTLQTLITRYKDVELIFPVHRNPNVREPVDRIFRNTERIHLLDPLDYSSFVRLMVHADLVLTDSGGIQEEAPSLKKPVLVLRNKTERPEGIEAGVARLVGTDPRKIKEEVSRLMEDPRRLRKMATAANPYGDGQAAKRIVRVLASFFRRPVKRT